MEAEQFDALVGRLRVAARRRPGVFKLRLALLAALGYAYILLLLGLILAAAALLPVFLLAPALILIALMVKSLWVRVPAPPGHPVERHDAARLHREIDALRAKLYIPALDTIQLDESFNAAVHQIPRLGILGWNRSYLTLGLPLLLALSPQQFRAVLAHEMCHLFGGHSRFGTWMYRAGASWERLMNELEARDAPAGVLFRGFFRWYVPRLNAGALALARVHEVGCDRFAADLMGSRDKADALIWTRLKGRYHDTLFWKQIWARCAAEPQPPADAFSRMRVALRENPAPEQARQWLEETLREVTPSGEVHPSLADRLESLGEPPRVPPPLEESAAEVFLGASLERYLADFSAAWRRRAEAAWTERHQQLHTARQRLAEIESIAAGARTPRQRLEHASLVDDVRGDGQAVDLYRALTADPEVGPQASFAAGRILLESEPAEAITLLEHAMDAEPDFTLEGCGLIYQHLLSRGDAQGARKYFTRARRHQELLSLAERERMRLDPRDRFLHHQLPPGEVQPIVEALARFPLVRLAYLVRKEVKHLPQKPCYVLALVWKARAIFRSEARLLLRLAQRLDWLPREYYVFSVHNNRRLRNRIGSVPGALIFRRPLFGKPVMAVPDNT